MAVAVKSRVSFEVGTPVMLFQFRAAGVSAARLYDVNADGQKFLINVVGDEALVPLTVVLNWEADLKQ